MKLLKFAVAIAALGTISGCVAVPVGSGYGYYSPEPVYAGPPPVYYGPPVIYGPSIGIGVYGGYHRRWR
jgi:hypothetical protein